MKNSNGISDEKLNELKTKASEILSVVRQNILIRYPFTGSILMKLDIVPVRDYRVRTACTDGKTIYFDIDFLTKISHNDQIFVLSHEVWHVIMLHILRCQNRNQELFNIATDMEVNYMLSMDGLKMPNDLVYPPSNLEGKSAEECYEYLLKKMKNDMKNQQNGNSSNKNGNSSKTDGGSKGNHKSNNGTDVLTGQFDKHVYDQNGSTQNSDNESNNGNDSSSEHSQYGVSDQWGDVGEDPDYHPTVSKRLADEMREAIVSAAQQVERMRGDLPAHIKRVVEGLVKSEVNWKEELARFVTTNYKMGEHRWVPPSRRHVYRNLYLPSNRNERIDVVVGIDTSGSTSADLSKFFSELMALISSFNDYHITVIQCDAEVGSVEEYDNNDNPFEFNIKDFVFTGGGGTDMNPIFQEIEKRGIETQMCIVFTDGYITKIENKPNYPVMWVLTSNGSEEFCDFGHKIRFKNDNKNNYYDDF